MSKKLFLIVFISLTCFYSKAQVAATIDVAQVKQVIDGFGASTAWHTAITDVEADAGFGNATNSQLGLSIIRVRISPTSTDWSGWGDEKKNAVKAKARGAKVLATPWSPPPALKDNNNIIKGSLKPESYAAYAAHLKSFCTYLGNVDVISIQNEPNITVDYESCIWTPAQILEFCKTNAPSIGTPVMAPEAYNFANTFADPILNDPIASANIEYIGGHIYGTSARSYPLANSKNKKLWMTEYYIGGDSIGTGLIMAKDILDCMNGNMNAYIWWYLRVPGCNLINTDGSLQLKGATMGQFSKFIRPGYFRVQSNYQPNAGIIMQAFKGPEQDVIVVINKNTTVKSQTFNFSNENIVNATKYVTSATKKISNDGVITCTNNSFTDNLDAKSITTYVVKRVPSAVNNLKNTEISLFPNPANNFLQLSTIDNINSLYIVNSLGQKIINIKNPQDRTINISNLASGTYIALINYNGAEKRIKFMKQ
jgi:glucuronoarabinoxylan endo-1,4-beta-xylanase